MQDNQDEGESQLPSSSRMKKSGNKHRPQNSQQYGFGPPINLPLLHQSHSSRNNELGLAKTQKTPKHGSRDDKHLGSPLSNGPNTVTAPFVSIPEVNCRKSSVISPARGEGPKTPQKQRRPEQNVIGKHATATFIQNQNNQLYSDGKNKQHKSSNKKLNKAKQLGIQGGEMMMPSAFKQGPNLQILQPNNKQVEIIMARDSNQNLQSSEKKSTKYDRMIQSLETVATKQRRKTATNHGSANKKGHGHSTEATEPHEARFGALSISSCISKNTGSNTIVSREKLAQLQQYQQHQLMMYNSKQQIFDRNRPWNCEYCQPKMTPAGRIDIKLNNFSRKCISTMVSRFMIKEEFYESRKVVELLNTNSRSVLVAQFKDFLIFDDIYEFLTSMYDLHTSLDILTRHAIFYDSLTSLEVLCQYREDQIRDRHLVLHGLKPCYISLEKQIQGILASNFRNKLRIILNQVRKVQIARGLHMDPSSSQESGFSSEKSTPVKSPGSGLTALQRASTNAKRKQSDFKKLIQSSMVIDYNFSRSQSGLLIAKDIMSGVIVDQMQFNTNSSINFTNISYEGEVEMLKGSMFENSIDKTMDHLQPNLNFENIDSMYMNAQMILDNLSSRPLTRQSMPKENTATPASRINMYELHKQEEHKIRLPFCLAPKKPLDQNTCSDSMVNSISLHVSKDDIKIINENHSGENFGASSALANKNQKANSFHDQNNLEAQILFAEKSVDRNTSSFQPFRLPNNGDQSSLKVHPEQSITSKDTVVVCSRMSQKVAEVLPAGMLTGLPNVQSAQQTSLSKTERLATFIKPSMKKELKLLPPESDSNNSQNMVLMRLKTQNDDDACSSDIGGYQIEKTLGTKQVTSDTNVKACPNSLKQQKSKKLSSNNAGQRSTETPDTKRSCNRAADQQRLTSNKAGNVSQPKRKGTPVLKNCEVKASPAIKNFNVSQFKLMSNSTRTLPTAQISARPFTGKKVNILSGNSKNQVSDATDGSSRDQIHSSQPRHAEDSAREKIKMSKKIIASIKKEMQMSPNQVQRHQLMSDREEIKKEKSRKPQQQESSPLNSISRQLTSKTLTSTKTMTHLTMKPCSIQQQNNNAVRVTSGTGKHLKGSGTKRPEERSKAASQRKNVAVAVFSDKPSLANLQLSSDNKRTTKPHKNLLSIKDQVILEALRKDQNSQSSQQLPTANSVVQRATSGHQYTTQNAVVLSSQAINNDPQMVKLMRAQQMPTTSKSLIANKVDLFSIAGKLKLLGQPIQNKNGTIMSASSLRQSDSQQNRKNHPPKFNSRKISVEQRDEMQFSRNNNSTQKQQNLRFFSADNHHVADECIKQPNNKTIKKTTSGTHVLTSAKRKLIIPSAQQTDPYYSQRSLHQQRSGALGGTQPVLQLNHHQFTAPQTHVVHSRNGACGLNNNEGGGSLDQRQVSQLQLATKTLTELHKLQVGQRKSISNTGIMTQTKSFTGQNSSNKKKITKLNRIGTGQIINSPQGLAETEVGAGTHAGPFVSPRKLLKDGTEGKTRNQNLGKSNNHTQSQQRIVTFHQGGHHHSLKQQNLTAAKSGQQLYQQAQHHTSQNALSPQSHHQSSRNGGLGMANYHHTTTVKTAVSLALQELQEKGGQVQTMTNLGKKGLQSQKVLQLASPSSFQMTSQVPLTAALMKQELKIHSRKNSAAYSLTLGQKLQTINHNQMHQAMAQTAMQERVTKSFGGGTGTGNGTNVAHKKTKKKQQ